MASPEPPELILNKDHRHLGPFALHRPWRDPGLERVRRGAYVDVASWESVRPRERYRLKVLAAVAAMTAPRVLSHESAAILLDLPIVGAWPEKIHVTQDRHGGGRSTGLIVRHTVKVTPPTEVVDGVAVTSGARTVVDLARTRSFPSALVSADHAVGTGLCTVDDLEVEVDRIRGGRGYRKARYVVERVDGRSESAGESLSRARMYELGLPVPDLQREFFDDDGFIGRVDFWWEHLRLVGEFDGVVKYHRDDDRDLPPEEIVLQEKFREDRLRARVRGVVRWTWDVALRRERLGRVLHRAGVVPLA